MQVRTNIKAGPKEENKQKRKAVMVKPGGSPIGMNTASLEYHAASAHNLKNFYNPFVNPHSATKQVGKNPTADSSGSFGGGV